MRLKTPEELLDEVVESFLPIFPDQYVIQIDRDRLIKQLDVVLRKNQIDDDANRIIDDIETVLKSPQLMLGFLVSYDYFSDTLRIEYIPSVPHLERIIETYEQNIRKDLERRIRKLSPFGFEDLVGEVLNNVPWARNVEVTFRSKDGGIDFVGYYFDPRVNLTFRLVGEAKHWKSPVGVKPIREFIGVLASRENRVHKIGLYMSSSGYTKNALDEISNSPVRILTFDLDNIIDLMIENEVGTGIFSMEGNVIVEEFWNDIDF